MIEPLEAGDVAVVLGLGMYGRAVTTALRARQIAVVAIEDKPSDTTEEFVSASAAKLITAPTADDLDRLFESKPTAFVPSPGIPEHHHGFAAARSAQVSTVSEFDMARWWDERPIVAITGTDGKTTVTMLVVDMLQRSGIAAMAVGNTETPLITAIDDPSVEIFVVEASSFRLGHTQLFEPAVGVWLNFGPDHLDVHKDLATYELAKSKIWANLAKDAVAVAYDLDPVVMAHAPVDRRVVTVGSGDADGHRTGDDLILHGEILIGVDEMPRAFDHDVTNALAAAAAALEVGAERVAITDAIRNQTLLPHRIQFVGTVDGVDYYNDSKATVPHAVVTALRSFDRVVLIAGGRNKGLDLAPIAAAADHLEAVVAIGEAAAEVESALGSVAPTERADDMADAVRRARKLAHPGVVVLLSPGCASYDAYTSYVARGDDFIRLVTNLVAGGTPQ